MKTLKKMLFMALSFIALTSILTSCSSDDDKSSNPSDSSSLYKGNFVSSAHPTSGSATINLDKTKLNFTSFMSDNGPNLDIYLVENLNNVNANYIDLGGIKGLNGSYSYDLPANIDFSVYKHVVVWCTDFSVNFGFATLIEQ